MRRPASSAPSPEVTGPRPVATSKYSAFSLRLFPSGVCASRSTPAAPVFALVTRVPVRTLMPCFLNERSSSVEIASSSTGTMRGSSSISVTSLPKRRKIEPNSTPTAPVPMITIDLGIALSPIASSLVMIRLRSISTPGTLRGCDPVATMISLRAVSVCCCPSVTSTLPFPARRPLPLIQSILFFLNSSSTPPVRPLTIRSLRDWTCAMSRPMAASPSVKPHSFQSWAILSECACSSSAFVGMQPQFRQVPPRTGARSTTAVRRPSCAARIAATYPPVPDPITTTSYSLAIYLSFFLIVESGTKETVAEAAGGGAGCGSPLSGSSRDTCERSRVYSYRRSQYDWVNTSSRRETRRASPSATSAIASPLPATTHASTTIYLTKKSRQPQAKPGPLRPGPCVIALQSGILTHGFLEDDSHLRRRSGDARHDWRHPQAGLPRLDRRQR